MAQQPPSGPGDCDGSREGPQKPDDPPSRIEKAQKVREWAVSASDEEYEVLRAGRAREAEVRGSTLDRWRTEAAKARVSKPVGNLTAIVSNIQDHPEWMTRYGVELNENGLPRASRLNIRLYLTHHREIAGNISQSELDGLVYVRSMPWEPEGAGAWRLIRDIDYVLITEWLDRHMPGRDLAMVSGIVDVVAGLNKFNPIRDYLESIKWDGVRRIDTWLSDYCSAKIEGEDQLADRIWVGRVSRYWLISAVARALWPGCEVHGVLVLSGIQGLGKTSVAKVLAGPWYGSGHADMSSKDAVLAIHGRWIIELTELASLRRSQVEDVKRYLSECVDRFRPPYGRSVVDQPRSCVFLGTTNDEQYLTDQTGNRRFWGVSCQAIDVSGLAAVRDQLWAEAVAAFKAGDQWWFPACEEVEIVSRGRLRAADRLERHPWHDHIREYLESRSGRWISTKELLTTALGITTDRQNLAASRAVGDIMMELGWARERRRVGKDVQRGWNRPKED